MLTLAEFLLARIADDEAVASPLANADTRSALREGSRDYVESTPVRVLAECEAKRRIVGEHKMMEPRFNVVWRDGCCETCTAWGEYGGPNEDGTPNPCPTLRFLALPYADHDDYREEWRP